MVFIYFVYGNADVLGKRSWKHTHTKNNSQAYLFIYGLLFRAQILNFKMICHRFHNLASLLLSSSINNISGFIKSLSAGPDLIINTLEHWILSLNYSKCYFLPDN